MDKERDPRNDVLQVVPWLPHLQAAAATASNSNGAIVTEKPTNVNRKKIATPGNKHEKIQKKKELKTANKRK